MDADAPTPAAFLPDPSRQPGVSPHGQGGSGLGGSDLEASGSEVFTSDSFGTERVRDQALATRAAQRLAGPAEAIRGYQELIVEELSLSGPAAALADALKVLDAARALDDLVNRVISARDTALDEMRLRHDLRTPVNAILGYSELLIEDFETELATATLADIGRVIAECGAFLAQVDGLLDRSRGDADQQGTKVDADIAAALERTLALPVTEAVEPGRILVIDDVEANRELLRRHLTRRGHVVDTAASAADALDRLASQGFDVLLVDILMPDMNGIELLALLKADPRWRDIPVIMVSGLKETAAVVRCIAAGAEDYLQKPIDPILLHSRVGAGLDRVRWLRREQQFLARIEYERDRADALLHMMLPVPVIRRLRDGEAMIADRFDTATIIFADIVDFTPLVARTEPQVLLAQLAAIFSAFDDLADTHGIEKIKTIGDAYMAAAGIPDPAPDHAARALAFCRDIIRTMTTDTGHGLSIRVGLHSGPVIAGLIGRKRFVYDVWGDTVNLASRLESAGAAGRIHLSEAAHAILAGQLRSVTLQETALKGFGRVTSFLAD